MNARCGRMVGLLVRATEGMGREEAIERLVELGIAGERGCERAAIRVEVERLVRGGRGRCEAMEEVAEAFGCSYGKVRNIIYYKAKN